jgi:hypothetical protein
VTEVVCGGRIPPLVYTSLLIRCFTRRFGASHGAKAADIIGFDVTRWRKFAADFAVTSELALSRSMPFDLAALRPRSLPTSAPKKVQCIDADHVAAMEGGRPCGVQTELRQPGKHLLEENLQFDPCQMRPQAAMRAGVERDVHFVGAIEIALGGILEMFRVEIGAWQHQ